MVVTNLNHLTGHDRVPRLGIAGMRSSASEPIAHLKRERMPMGREDQCHGDPE